MEKSVIALVVTASLWLSSGCADDEPASRCPESRQKQSQEWCDQMLEKPNAEWVEEDYQSFSCDCI
ncbi:DUF3012 domain-containing protein [Teredinibacter turnerae]|uniref:DUF3012 domain-containing protein n=1 Tax=Teredinibacter turnerae TaxID=2426 RepID=UPI0012BD0A6F|nr:DUF3012 domain-containing protein [Teredinibacter turnerae]